MPRESVTKNKKKKQKKKGGGENKNVTILVHVYMYLRNERNIVYSRHTRKAKQSKGENGVGETKKNKNTSPRDKRTEHLSRYKNKGRHVYTRTNGKPIYCRQSRYRPRIAVLYVAREAAICHENKHTTGTQVSGKGVPAMENTLINRSTNQPINRPTEHRIQSGHQKPNQQEKCHPSADILVSKIEQ